MFKKPQNLKGLTVNLVLGLFKQCSHVQIFLWNESLWIALTFYGINFKNINFILTNHFLVTACPVICGVSLNFVY